MADKVSDFTTSKLSSPSQMSYAEKEKQQASRFISPGSLQLMRPGSLHLGAGRGNNLNKLLNLGNIRKMSQNDLNVNDRMPSLVSNLGVVGQGSQKSVAGCVRIPSKMSNFDSIRQGSQNTPAVDVSIPSRVTNLGKNGKGANVTIPSRVTNLGKNGKGSAGDVSIPSRVTNLSNNGKGSAVKLNVTIPSRVTNLGKNVKGSDVDVDVSTPSRVTNLGNNGKGSQKIELLNRGNIRNISENNSIDNVRVPTKRRNVSLDPPYIPPTIESDEESDFNNTNPDPQVSPVKKRRRGANTCAKVTNLPKGEKLKVQFYQNRVVGDNHPQFSRYIGKLVRDWTMCPVKVHSWNGIKEDAKDHMWESVKAKFTCDNIDNYREPTLEHMKELWNKWRNRLHTGYVRPCETMEEAVKNIPETLEAEDWEWLVKEHFFSKKFLKSSKTNEENRKRKSNLLTPRT